MRFSSRWLARLLLACVLVALVPFLVSCGGEEPFEFDFDDLPPEEEVDTGPPPTLDPFRRLTGQELRLVRLDYLHDVGAMLAQIERSRRQIILLVDDAAEPVSTDWVVDVHTAHRTSEEMRLRFYSFPLPADLAEDYVTFHAGFLETVQMYSYAADRLVAAAITLGPTGRVSTDMDASQESEFRSLLAEANYYLLDTEILLSRAEDDLKLILKDLRVR